MIGQPNGAGTSLPLINQFMNQPLVYIRNPTSALNSNFDVSSPGLQTYAFLQQNNNPFQLQPQVISQSLPSTVQVLPSSAFHQLPQSFQSTLAYIPAHQHAAIKRRASDCVSPLSSSCKNVENKKLKLDGSTSPRRILHFKGLPSDITKSEVMQLSSICGVVKQILLRGNEAFVEMGDSTSAQNTLAYYSQKSLALRNHLIKVQFSETDQVDFSSQEGPEVELNSAQEIGEKSAVLVVSVEHVIYPVTVDAIKKMFAPYGHILAIATFTTNDSSHLLIQFLDRSSAENAKTALNGQCMYTGGNRLKVEYSAITSLEPQQTQSPISYSTFDPSSLVHPLVFETPLQQPQTFTILNHADLIAKSKDFISLGSNAIIEQKYMTQFGTPIIAGSLNNQVLLPQTSLLSMGNVLLVSNLDEAKVSPDALFTLFGVYGDVIRVKIMFNKKDTALIQFNDAIQAQTALLNLDKLKLWGKVIKVAPSKHTSVQMPKEGQPGASLTKDYKSSPLHRFKKPNSKNYSNIFPPSSTLHLSNIPSTSKEKLIELFSEYGSVVGFKFFNNVVSANRDCKMALMQMSSVEEAAHALIGLHNHQLAETTHLRVSFSKSSVVAQPSPGEQQDSKEQSETESAIQNSGTSSVEIINSNNN